MGWATLAGLRRDLIMSDIHVFELHAELCRALGHSARLQLVHLLREGPQCVSDLAHMTGLGQGTVSRHLAVLRNCGILSVQTKGRETHYQISDPRIMEICDLMRMVLVEQLTKRSEVLRTLDHKDETG
jgi:ArsR family transcriptional regulator, virulence genes transcriptional regulator